MTALSEMKNPELGLEVISAIGTPGKVFRIQVMTAHDTSHWRDSEVGELLITVKWEHDGHSTFPQSQFDAVQVKDLSPVPRL
jgi:hypothetical protein